MKELLSSELGQRQVQSQVGINRISGDRVEGVSEMMVEESPVPADGL